MTEPTPDSTLFDDVVNLAKRRADAAQCQERVVALDGAAAR